MFIINLVISYPSQGSSNSNVSNSDNLVLEDLNEIINSAVADELYNYIKSHDNNKIVLQTSHGEKISIRIEPDFSYGTFFSFLFLAVFLLSLIGFSLKELNNKNK